MALSFLYLAFLRTRQILRLQRSDNSDLAIEVVVLRHEVAIHPQAAADSGPALTVVVGKLTLVWKVQSLDELGYSFQ
ncbi:MAG TPA: hypothetical protein VNG12_05080 [Acidimicrobiales bacterium]|nr:hypothetical protein [Acidimicrobiales bacterium]